MAASWIIDEEALFEYDAAGGVSLKWIWGVQNNSGFDCLAMLWRFLLAIRFPTEGDRDIFDPQNAMIEYVLGAFKPGTTKVDRIRCIVEHDAGGSQSLEQSFEALEGSSFMVDNFWSKKPLHLFRSLQYKEPQGDRWNKAPDDPIQMAQESLVEWDGSSDLEADLEKMLGTTIDGETGREWLWLSNNPKVIRVKLTPRAAKLDGDESAEVSANVVPLKLGFPMDLIEPDDTRTTWTLKEAAVGQYRLVACVRMRAMEDENDVIRLINVDGAPLTAPTHAALYATPGFVIGTRGHSYMLYYVKTHDRDPEELPFASREADPVLGSLSATAPREEFDRMAGLWDDEIDRELRATKLVPPKELALREAQAARTIAAERALPKSGVAKEASRSVTAPVHRDDQQAGQDNIRQASEQQPSQPAGTPAAAASTMAPQSGQDNTTRASEQPLAQLAATPVARVNTAAQPMLNGPAPAPALTAMQAAAEEGRRRRESAAIAAGSQPPAPVAGAPPPGPSPSPASAASAGRAAAPAVQGRGALRGSGGQGGRGRGYGDRGNLGGRGGGYGGRGDGWSGGRAGRGGRGYQPHPASSSNTVPLGNRGRPRGSTEHSHEGA